MLVGEAFVASEWPDPPRPVGVSTNSTVFFALRIAPNDAPAPIPSVSGKCAEV